MSTLPGAAAVVDLWPSPTGRDFESTLPGATQVLVMSGLRAAVLADVAALDVVVRPVLAVLAVLTVALDAVGAVVPPVVSVTAAVVVVVVDDAPGATVVVGLIALALDPLLLPQAASAKASALSAARLVNANDPRFAGLELPVDLRVTAWVDTGPASHRAPTWARPQCEDQFRDHRMGAPPDAPKPR